MHIVRTSIAGSKSHLCRYLKFTNIKLIAKASSRISNKRIYQSKNKTNNPWISLPAGTYSLSWHHQYMLIHKQVKIHTTDMAAHCHTKIYNVPKGFPACS